MIHAQAESGDQPQTMKIPYNRNHRATNEQHYVEEVLSEAAFGAPYPFQERCRQWLEQRFESEVIVTQSCTDALEMAALLCRVGPGDEVILPSFTFSSTATAFALRGAELVFVDIEPELFTIDVEAVAQAVTARTKVIVAVNYAGNPCDTAALRRLCDERDVVLVEDAAQSMMTERGGRQVGMSADLTTVSFHNTKNIHCGEGGALIVNSPEFRRRAHILAEKGTNRRAFFLGEVDKYSWVDLGTSALPSELTSALLLSQLEDAVEITELRRTAWSAYRRALRPLAERGLFTLPVDPEGVRHNAHIFHILVNEPPVRDELIRFMRDRAISAPFHYLPLHRSRAGRRHGRLSGHGDVTDRVSSTLIRLPLWPGVPVEPVVRALHDFFGVGFDRDPEPVAATRTGGPVDASPSGT